jgi:localization factor PodJL
MVWVIGLPEFMFLVAWRSMRTHESPRGNELSMSQKRSILDSLNAGRHRRPSTSIERLDRTLNELEERIERGQPRQEQSRHHERDDWDLGRRPEPAPHYSMLERNVRQARTREEEFASVSQIAADLQSLRDELRSQSDSGVGSEIAALRRDIEKSVRTQPSADQPAALGRELERLSSMIDRMAQRGDDRAVNTLRREIEEIKSALAELAREDTVRSVGRRWEELDQRWDALASDLRTVGQGSPGFEVLEDRLSRIEGAVRALPESLSLRTLEDKLRTLAGVVDNLSHHQDRFGADAVETIERRLDELSRAIAASTSAQHAHRFDPEPLERIEARIGALARQIEDLQANAGYDISGQMESIAQRVDELAHRVEMPESAVARLAEQINVISQKLETVPSGPSAHDFEPLFLDLERRFASISARMEERQDDAIEQGRHLLRDLEQRIESLAMRRGSEADAGANDEILELMDRRLAEISDRFERQLESAAGHSGGQLEHRLDDIARRLESTSQGSSEIDRGLLLSLQAQLETLAEHIVRPERPLPELEDLGPRLDYIERSIVETRENLMEAAHRAAEQAVRSLSENADTALASELGQDLRSLENLTRLSDERNAKTFEAIHDTLIKIVDRLGSMEKRQGRPPVAARETHDAPPMAPESVPELERPEEPHIPRTAAEAASLAARIAATAGDTKQEQKPTRSILGGLRRALGGNKGEKAETDAPNPEAERREPKAVIDFDAPLDPEMANRPLEPGSGTPDLNAIMRRVRDQNDLLGGQDSDAAKSDFIAAARRAAQAAAAEAEATKISSGGKKPTSGGLARFLPKGRKSAMIGLTALVVVLGALQLGRSFITEQGRPADPTQSMAAIDLIDEAEQIDAETTPVVAEADDQAAPQVNDTPATPRMIGQIGAGDPLPQSQFVAPDSPATTIETSAEFIDETETAALHADESLPDPLVSVPVEAGPAALREAAEMGDPLALFEIGNRYADGRGVPANPEIAAEWYEMAAELGLAVAQYKIAGLYEKGIGVERDVSVAESWYRQAAAQGNAGAMHNLGVLLAMGANGTTDNEEAARWFMQAAEFGVPDSQFNMGILTAKGIGMRQDLEEGYKWFALLAAGGDADAAAKRDEVAAMLSPEQLERAKAAAALWRVKQPDPASNSYNIPEGWTESGETTASIDMRQALSEIQTILNGRGYDAGPVDGVMGQKTRSAIMAFQRDNGLAATGDIDQSLVRALLAQQ